jgi:threonine aldolase
VLWHSYSHLARHEGEAYARLHHLVGRTVGDQTRLISLDDLKKVAEPFAALVLELPQRDLGGQLPPWEELVAQTEWARRRGVAHLDGARLWEAAAGYGRSPADVADLFDTVYVSFYKAVGALPGCCVAGSAETVAEVKEWRQRLGGTLFALWPAASSARQLLPAALAEMPARMAHALAIAEALAGVPGVRPVPAVPQTPMMHLLLDTTRARYAERAKRFAEEDGLWVWSSAMATEDPDVVRLELSVGSATLRHDPTFIASVLQELAASAA